MVIQILNLNNHLLSIKKQINFVISTGRHRGNHTLQGLARFRAVRTQALANSNKSPA